MQNLKYRRIGYFLWEEKHWPGDEADFTPKADSRDLKMVGTWDHPDTGKLILFKVIQ